MTSFIRLAFILGLAILFSCGDDDESTVSLEGNWKVTSLEYFECTGATTNSLRECGTFTFCATWDFKSDGTSTIFYEGGGTTVSTYTVYPGNSIGFCSTSCNNMAYTLAGNKLTISTITPASNDCMQRYSFEKI